MKMNGGLFCICITLFVFCMVTLILGIHYGNHLSATSHQCHLTNVIYPTRLPLNTSDKIGFIECDCGKRCTSDLGTCISIYGYISDASQVKLFNSKINGNDNSQCTFREGHCTDGENIDDRLRAIEIAKENALPYVNILNNNQTIDCWHFNDSIYLENNYDLVAFIVVCSITGFLMILLSAIYVRSTIKIPENSENSVNL